MSKIDIQQFSRDFVPAEGELNIRKLPQAELPLVRNHLIRLDHETLYFRFGNCVSDETLAQHVERMKNIDTSIFGCCIRGRIRGIAELRCYRVGREHRAEAALTVEKTYLDLGIGSALMVAVFNEARGLGVREILLCFDFRDRHMLGIAEKFQASCSFEGTDCVGRISI